jgi:hypothetical protein
MVSFSGMPEGSVAGFQIARQVREELGIFTLGVHFSDAGEVGMAVIGAGSRRVEVHCAVCSSLEFG